MEQLIKTLSFMKSGLPKDNLKHIFSNDVCCEIHGDLTIENIIGERAEERTFYFIDPNTGNLHESKALVMQNSCSRYMVAMSF